MKLHIFNPDHDVALASNMDAFTAPHAARELRADLGYLPALWANDGDMVLVDDVSAALESARRLGGLVHDVLFISHADLCRVPIDFSTVKVEPWGVEQGFVSLFGVVQRDVQTNSAHGQAIGCYAQAEQSHVRCNPFTACSCSITRAFCRNQHFFLGRCRSVGRPAHGRWRAICIEGTLEQ